MSTTNDLIYSPVARFSFEIWHHKVDFLTIFTRVKFVILERATIFVESYLDNPVAWDPFTPYPGRRVKGCTFHNGKKVAPSSCVVL